MSEEESIYLTEEGAQALREELAELSGPRRIELAARLRNAIQQGDLTENADYTAAKEEQGFLEGRIQQIEETLRRAEIVSADEGEASVVIGSTVVVQEEGGAPETYRLVGSIEADVLNGKISYESPIGSALLGKRAGEIAVAQTPSGPLKLRVLSIQQTSPEQ
jgi:transcription elongation factor GreA